MTNIFNQLKKKITTIILFIIFGLSIFLLLAQTSVKEDNNTRQRISIDNNWRFFKYNSPNEAGSLVYDVRPDVKNYQDDKPADSKPTEAEKIKALQMVLKPWIMPTGNEFIRDVTKHYIRPEGNPGSNFPFVKIDFNDSAWEQVNLPHDWAIKEPFYESPDPEVGDGMGGLMVIKSKL
jgi:beta-galactosidase